jgi:hypothetical protein
VAIKTERLNFAVEAASRCQAIGATLCSNETITAAYAAKAAGVDASNFTVAREACGISVTAAYQYKPMLLPAMPLSATACYPVPPT